MKTNKPERICFACGRPLVDDQNKMLLNPPTLYYAFRLNWTNWGNGLIMDERGTIIGSVRTTGKAPDFRLFESDVTPILSIHKKFLRNKYDLFTFVNQ